MIRIHTMCTYIDKKKIKKRKAKKKFSLYFVFVGHLWHAWTHAHTDGKDRVFNDDILAQALHLFKKAIW